MRWWIVSLFLIAAEYARLFRFSHEYKSKELMSVELGGCTLVSADIR